MTECKHRHYPANVSAFYLQDGTVRCSLCGARFVPDTGLNITKVLNDRDALRTAGDALREMLERYWREDECAGKFDQDACNSKRGILPCRNCEGADALDAWRNVTT